MLRLPTRPPETMAKRSDAPVLSYTSHFTSSSSSLTCGLGVIPIRFTSIRNRYEITCIFFWVLKLFISPPRSPQLLIAVSSTLPFLAVRVIFSVLNAFSHNISFSSSSPPSDNTGSLSKFNLVTGEWWIYLVMSLLMEYITVLIYSITGTLIPHSRGEGQGEVDIEMRK
jgi:hypothetical protein